MAANPALFIRIAGRIDDFKKNIAEGKVQIEALGSSVKRMQESFDGSKLKTQANTIVAAIGSIENAAKLSTKEAQRFTAQLDEAIEKHKRLGVEAPKEWALMAEATRQAAKPIAEGSAATATWRDRFTQLNSTLGQFGLSLSGLGLAGITTAVIGMGKAAIDTAGKITDLSAATGLTYQELQRLSYAGNKVGVDMDAVAKGVQQVQKRLVEGDAGAVSALRQLNLAADDLLRLSPGAMFERIGEAMSRVPDPAKRTALAFELLGKTGTSLLPLLTADMADLERGAVTMSDSTVEALDRVDDAWAALKLNTKAVIGELIGAFASMPDPSTRFTPAGWIDKFIDSRTTFNPSSLPKVSGPGGTGPQAAGVLAFDASALAKQERDLTDAIQKRVKASEDAAARMKAIQDRLYGVDKINAVKAEIEAVLAMSGGVASVTMMTDAAQKSLKADIDAAIVAYAKLGQTAPANLLAVRDALVPLVDTQQALLGGLKRSDVLTPSLTGSALTAHHAGLPGYSDKLSALPMAFFSREKLTAPASLSERLFGRPSQQFGTGLAQTIVNARAGGGNAGQAVGAFVGSSMGGSLAKTLAGPAVQTAIKGALGGVIGGAANMLLPGVGALMGPLAGKVGAMLSAGIEKFAGNATKKDREALAKKLGFGDLGALTADLNKMGEQGRFLADFGANRIGRNDKAGNAAWMKNVEDFYRNTNAVLDKYGLSLDEINGKHKTLAESMGADYERLKKLGFGDEKLAKAMAGGLNDAVRAALTSGEAIPRNMKPVLESLIRSGGLSDDLARKLLGIAEPVRRDWRKMQEAAERYGLSVDQLGNGFKAAQLDELVEQLRTDWELLAIPGADTNAILAAMVPHAQRLLDASKKWGYEIPAAMRPILERMLAMGLLVDENGNKLETLDGLNFGADLTKKIDELIAKLGELIDKLTGPDGVADALDEAFQAAVPGVPSTAGTGQPSVPNPNNTDPYLPDGTINPYGPYGYQLPQWGGAQAAGGDYLVTRPTMFLAGEAGPEQVSFSGANRAFGAAATVIVEIDGRTLAQTLIPVLPGELRRLRLA